MAFSNLRFSVKSARYLTVLVAGGLTWLPSVKAMCNAPLVMVSIGKLE